MLESSQMIIFLLVIGARFLLPFLIIRYPLAIILCLIVDAVDQTIFQLTLSPEAQIKLDAKYQSYDKALDIYYLTIAYISTLRNWENINAFKTSKFLYYYRLVGATLFELSHIRALLLIFPNTFEYFFIFIESIRTRWKISNLSLNFILIGAALIWIIIKLPQEYWIHIAQLDTTDLIKAAIENGYGQILAILTTLIVIIFTFSLIKIYRRLPEKNWKFNMKVDKYQVFPKYNKKIEKGILNVIFKNFFIEKIFMTTLVTIIFTQLLSIQTSIINLISGISLLVLFNIIVSHLFRVRSHKTIALAPHLTAVVIINLITILSYSSILSNSNSYLNFNAAIFFALLLGILITLFDRYSKVYKMRLEMK